MPSRRLPPFSQSGPISNLTSYVSVNSSLSAHPCGKIKCLGILTACMDNAPGTTPDTQYVLFWYNITCKLPFSVLSPVSSLVRYSAIRINCQAMLKESTKSCHFPGIGEMRLQWQWPALVYVSWCFIYCITNYSCLVPLWWAGLPWEERDFWWVKENIFLLCSSRKYPIISSIWWQTFKPHWITWRD